MTKTEIENKIYDLKRVVESCKNIIKANENEIKKLEAEKEKVSFERAGENKEYHTVSFSTGRAFAISSLETRNSIIAGLCFENNNYFLTEERAGEVADKINFLLKLERLHDTFCPDYKPDWDDDSAAKWYVVFDNDQKVYTSYSYWTNVIDSNTAYFDSKKTADKVCEILNKELENEDM